MVVVVVEHRLFGLKHQFCRYVKLNNFFFLFFFFLV